MNEEDEGKIKRTLLGEMNFLAVPGAFIPSSELLNGVFESPQSIIWGFCSGCGIRMEMTHQVLDEFKESGLTVSENISGMYISFDRCVFCDTSFKVPTFQQIPKV